jgi:hypothetical protein
MDDRIEWFTLVDEHDTVVGTLAPEVAARLTVAGIAASFFDGSARLRLCLPVAKAHARITVTVPSSLRLVLPPTPTGEEFTLGEHLVAGEPDPSTEEEVFDVQPDVELEALWKGDAEEVLSAFAAHTEHMKTQPGFSRTPYTP